jgi:hypothetical protein
MSSPLPNNSISPPSDNEKGKRNMNASRHEKFAMANSFANDLAASRNATPPDVPYDDPDYPICASCSRPMEHYEDDHRYRCNFCMVAVHENHVRHSLHVKNREKSLSEKASMSAEDQLKEIATQNALREQYRTANKSRLATQSGADHESGNTTASGGYQGGNVPGGGSFYQIADIRENARRQRDHDTGRYSDHTRSSGTEPYVEPHPLDRELIDKGFRITSST